MNQRSKRLDAHSLRTTFARMLADADVTEEVIDALQGRTRRTVAAMHYTGTPGWHRLVGAVAKLDGGVVAALVERIERGLL